ncbi:MAG: hypothetical protein AB1656_02535 [Candidatus Omnitrophota bacterium]
MIERANKSIKKLGVSQELYTQAALWCLSDLSEEDQKKQIDDYCSNAFSFDEKKMIFSVYLEKKSYK